MTRFPWKSSFSFSPVAILVFLCSTLSSVRCDPIFVGEAGEISLPCDYEGELSERISGAVNWIFEPTTGSSEELVKAWPPSKNPEPQILEKFKDNVTLSQQAGSAAIFLSGFSSQMEGIYKCNLILADGSDVKINHDVKLSFLNQPILFSGESRITILEGQVSEIHCDIFALPAPTVSWRLNGLAVDQKSIKMLTSDSKPNLHISVYKLNPRKSQQDEVVECIANGPAVETVPSRKAQWPSGIVSAAPLNVNYPPDAPYITLEEDLWFYESTLLALGCTVSDRGNPPAKISMVFPDFQMTETETNSFVQKTFRLLPSYNGEKIACTAKSPISRLTKVTTKTLKVAYGPFDVKIEGNRKFKEDSPDFLRLRCTASQANPRATITWSGFRPEIAKIVNETQLLLNPTWRDHGTKITCTGSNPYNDDRSKDVEQSIRLNVLHPPRWNGTKESKTVAKASGQEALLPCNVVANPGKDLKYDWYYNGQKVGAGDAREIKIRAEPSRFGSYLCRAHNTVGSTDFIVQLIDADLIAKEGAKYQTALIGGIIAAILIVIIICLLLTYFLRNRESKSSPQSPKRRSPSIEEEEKNLQVNHDDTPSNEKPPNDRLIYADVTPTKEPNANNPLIRNKALPTDYAVIDYTRNGGTPAHRRPVGGVPVFAGLEGGFRPMKSTPI